jgi:hypothetical protein
LPEEDLLNATITDTISISAYTISMDTLETSYVTQLIAGDYDDPIFGNTTAGFITQFAYPFKPSILDGYTADSVVLQLPYSYLDEDNYYGSLLSSQSLEVYRVSTDLSFDSTYYSNNNPARYYNGELMGTKIFTPKLSDSLITITLKPGYADTLLFANTSAYDSDEDFKKFFKGIYVKSTKTSGTGVLLKFRPDDNMIIKSYYHKDTDPDSALSYNISASYNYPSNVKFNLFNHNYSTSTFITSIDDTTSIQDSVAYIQGAGGLRTKIMMPYLELLNNLGKIQIYRAQLVIKTAPSAITNEDLYPANTKMVLSGVNPVKEYELLDEYNLGTVYNSVEYADGEYRFDIASYLRDILEGKKENYGLYLFTSGGRDDFNRTVITTGKNSNPMKLVLTYTKI